MLLLIHIVAAIAGLATAGASILTPSQRLLGLAYGLLGATIASGTALMLYAHAPIAATCVSGVAYAAVMLALTAVGKFRLARSLKSV